MASFYMIVGAIHESSELVLIGGFMANIYGKMMDSAFGPYYERFRALKAVSKDNAVSGDTLFPEGQTIRDKEAMHKMLSSGIVKRVGLDNYWLDEKVVSNPNGVLKQRLLVILGALAFAGLLLLLDHLGIIQIRN
jgi:hypothetical protein